MKRLVKKSGIWWEPNLPGAMSDDNKYAVVSNNEVIIYDGDKVERIVSFNKLDISNNDSEEKIRAGVINLLNAYLSH